MPELLGKILIADDDALIRTAYKSALQRAGHTVLCAQDGEEATRVIEAGGVGLLIIDILMPRKEGLETLIEMKRRFPTLIVIAMSAGGTRSETDFLSLATKFGADGILRKPFSPNELLALMSDLEPGRQTRISQLG